MTLMEAVVAMVILALVAVGCIELAQGASNLEYSATQWNAAVTMAESRMAEVVSGAPTVAPSTSLRESASDSAMRTGTQVTRESWRGGLDMIAVAVPVAGGKQFVLRRLIPGVARQTAGMAR